ncbi:MAG TPA: type II secretion system protein [Humisphaera sp.]
MRTTPAPRRPAGFTLVEMLATVALLVILLGLSVSLARHVRERSAQAVTTDLLRRLDALATRYAAGHGNAPPAVAPFPPPEATANARVGPDAPIAMEAPQADRQLLLRAALNNNRDVVAALRAGLGKDDRDLAELPVSISDGTHVRDAWGSPVVFMPQKHPWVGTAPRDKSYFFFSAGPDRDYLTRGDNLYSYEAARE